MGWMRRDVFLCDVMGWDRIGCDVMSCHVMSCHVMSYLHVDPTWHPSHLRPRMAIMGMELHVFGAYHTLCNGCDGGGYRVTYGYSNIDRE